MSGYVFESEWDRVSGLDGLRPFKAGGQPKLVLHTTQTKGKPNWQVMRSGLPHWTLDLSLPKVWQHLDTDVAAYTLENKGNGPSPNSDLGRVLQVEIIGYAEDSPTWDDKRYEVLSEFISWVCNSEGIPWKFPYAFIGDRSYGYNSSTRLSRQKFKDTAGVLGHQHVPANAHWDPGALNLEKLR